VIQEANLHDCIIYVNLCGKKENNNIQIFWRNKYINFKYLEEIKCGDGIFKEKLQDNKILSVLGVDIKLHPAVLDLTSLGRSFEALQLGPNNV